MQATQSIDIKRGKGRPVKLTPEEAVAHRKEASRKYNEKRKQASREATILKI